MRHETCHLGPQVAIIFLAFELARDRVRLTRATAGPHREIGREVGKSKGFGPQADSGKEMNLVELCEIGWLNKLDTSVIDAAVPKGASFDKFAEPFKAEGVNFIEVQPLSLPGDGGRAHASRFDSAVNLFRKCRCCRHRTRGLFYNVSCVRSCPSAIDFDARYPDAGEAGRGKDLRTRGYCIRDRSRHQTELLRQSERTQHDVLVSRAQDRAAKYSHSPADEVSR